MKAVTKNNEKEKTAHTWCTIFHWQKARNNARPPDTTKLQWKAILSVSDPMFGWF